MEHAGHLVRILSALAALSGCDLVFGLKDPGARDGGDATVIDGPAPADAATDAPELPLNVGCPMDYQVLSSVTPSTSFYRLVNAFAVRTDFVTAARDCENDRIDLTNHTHLLVLSSDSERVAVDSFLQGSTPWIGLHDRATEGTFRPASMEAPAYPPTAGAPWGMSQPATAVGNLEDCAFLQGTGSNIFDDQCTTPRPYVCECDAFEAVPVL